MRLVIIFTIALAAIWFGIVDTSWLDRRPVQRMLFLGHSLTYYNDMPSMVAKMADSAKSEIRYDITMQAFPNASVEDHWNNRKTRALLKQGDWDMVIVQPERHFAKQGLDSGLYVYGGRLLAATGTARRIIVISWTSDETSYQNDPVTRLEHFDNLQSNLRGLAYATGADVIDLARIWDDVKAHGLPFSLYKDGNHPSLEGSYLAALVVYAKVGQTGVDAVTYEPWGMSSDHAALLRAKVQAALNKTG